GHHAPRGRGLPRGAGRGPASRTQAAGRDAAVAPNCLRTDKARGGAGAVARGRGGCPPRDPPPPTTPPPAGRRGSGAPPPPAPPPAPDPPRPGHTYCYRECFG